MLEPSTLIANILVWKGALQATEGKAKHPPNYKPYVLQW